eukprot:gene909-536_t
MIQERSPNARLVIIPCCCFKQDFCLNSVLLSDEVYYLPYNTHRETLVEDFRKLSVGIPKSRVHTGSNSRCSGLVTTLMRKQLPPASIFLISLSLSLLEFHIPTFLLLYCRPKDEKIHIGSQKKSAIDWDNR